MYHKIFGYTKAHVHRTRYISHEAQNCPRESEAVTESSSTENLVSKNSTPFAPIRPTEEATRVR